MVRFIWEDFTNQKALQLRKDLGLENLIKTGKDEFEKQLLLKDWVHNTLPHGLPPKDYADSSAIEIFKDAKKGKKMSCTQYAFAFLQFGVALGWYTRKLGIDSDHQSGEEKMHHGVADIWSSQFKKWYVVDAMHNLHFEKDGMPLNSLEVRTEFLKNNAKDLQGVIGSNKETISYDKSCKGFDTPSNYFWFFISLRNNFFEKPGLYNTKALLWVDKYNMGKVWYKGGGKKGKSHKHPMYKSQFIKTSDATECFPMMG